MRKKAIRTTRRSFVKQAGALSLAGGALSIVSSDVEAQSRSEVAQRAYGSGKLLFYMAGNGVVATGIVDSSGAFSQQKSYPAGTFSTGWTHIVATSTGMILFYNASDGVVATGIVDSSGAFHQYKSYPAGTFSTGWTHIVATDNGMMLFYNASNGVVATGIVDSSGAFHQYKSYPAGTFSTGWTHIVAN